MKQQLEVALASIILELYDLEIDLGLTRVDEKFGDYSSNVAMQLAKKLALPPREIATAIVAKIATDMAELVAAAEIAGPGFINLSVNDDTLVKALQTTPAQSWAGKRVIVEYSDPNPFKPLHAGHLYTTLVGDGIARLLASSGAEVVRINYGGDVGLHVGKTMWAVIQTLGGELPEKLSEVPTSERAHWLGAQYVNGNQAYDESETARAEIIKLNARIYELHNADDHDTPLAQIYWTGRQWSYDYFTELYEQLRVTPFDRIIPESEIVPLGLEVVREQLDRGVYEMSDGAVVFKGEPFGLHTRVFINSKGLPTYEAKDVGLIMTKWRDYHFDRSIVITANEQQQYMAVMLASVAQFAPEVAQKSEHLTHGMVKLKGGVKMSSRKGNVADALEILEAAAAANQSATGQDNPDTVLGAVKYAFLKARIGGDIIYDPLESVSLEGNSGPYLQYAFARACSILSKAGYDDAALRSVFEAQAFSQLGDQFTFEPGERTLAAKLSEYPEILVKATDELMPHHVCTYLYELAQTFNRFYENNRVLGNEREAWRLQLVEAYAKTLRAALTILGLPTPERM